MRRRPIADRAGSTAIETALIAMALAVAVLSGLPLAAAEAARISASLAVPFADPAGAGGGMVRAEGPADRVAVEPLRTDRAPAAVVVRR